MAMNIAFKYVSTHNFRNLSGDVSVTPALPDASRLYVIYNSDTTYPAYVGTADSVKNRFAPRSEVLREVGFTHAAVSHPLIMVVKIEIDDTAYTPGTSGVANGIDVEHLLIRTYISKVRANVRNVNKTGVYTNNTGQTLNWHLVNDATIAHFGTHDYTLANGGTL